MQTWGRGDAILAPALARKDRARKHFSIKNAFLSETLVSQNIWPGLKIIFFFLVASQVPSFLFTHFFFPNIPPHSVPLPFSLSFFPQLPSFLSLLFAFLPFLSLSPFFLPGKFEYFCYLPGSAATTLLHFLSPVFGNVSTTACRNSMEEPNTWPYHQMALP